MKLRYAERVDQQIAEIVSFYNDAQRGLGDRFYASLLAKISDLLTFPESGPVVHHTARRSLVEGFPYLVLYELIDDYVTILAVIHGARDPEVIKGRVR